MSAGVEWLVPLVPADAVLANAQGVHNASTAEWAVAAILASLKYFPFYAEQQRLGEWVADKRVTETYKALHHDEARYPVPVLIEELYGKTVLIVGYGAIGTAIEERLAPLASACSAWARSAREGVSGVSELGSLLPEADIVVLITPLTDQTRHLIDEAGHRRDEAGRAAGSTRPRGGVVDTDALVAGLEAGKIRAALDVDRPGTAGLRGIRSGARPPAANPARGPDRARCSCAGCMTLSPSSWGDTCEVRRLRT